MDSIIAYLLGTDTVLLKMFFIAIGINWVIAILSSFYRGKFDSDSGLKSILKKIVYILVLILVTVIDSSVGLNGIMYKSYIFGITAQQIMSVITNATGMEINLGKALQALASLLQNSSDESAGNNNK